MISDQTRAVVGTAGSLLQITNGLEKRLSLFLGGVECEFLLIKKNPDVSPLTTTHLPISSSLVHLGGGATGFFCSMFVSEQTLDSRTPSKCF